MKVLSLFDGISCGRLALERAGVQVEKYIAYEIDDYAIKISRKNYPDIEHKGDVFEGDFTQYQDYDLLIGGSPCTHWSIANRNRETTNSGLGYELFSQYVRALHEAKPKYFLYENNYGINKEIKDSITQDLKVEPILIDSALVSGQRRLRLYWTNIPNVKQPEDKGILLSDVIEPVRQWRQISKWVYGLSFGKPKIERLAILPKVKKANPLTTKNTHTWQYYLNEDRTMYCNLSPIEYERLQTLPDNYTAGIPNAQRFKCVGNGWTVDVIAHILKGIK